MLPRPSVVISRAMPAAVLALVLILSITYLYHSPKSIGSSADFVRQHLPDIPAWNSNDYPSPPSNTLSTFSSVALTYTTAEAIPRPSSLPIEYNNDASDSEFCDNRFNVKYLANLRKASFQYCDASSYSSFTCFHSHTTDDDESDSLCITQGALVDMSVKDDKKFIVNCNVQEPGANNTARGVIPFGKVRQYWYDTGPRFIMDKHFDFALKPQAKLANQPSSRGQELSRMYTLLVKREGEGNPWHCLMEIWSMAMTMDVLRTAIDPADPKGQPYFRVPEDLSNLQVVILDDRVDGPYFGLWKLFSGREPIRLNQITGNPEAKEFFNNTNQRLILPLAGATNPVWQNDWKVRDCTRSDTLRAFVRRVLNHYDIHTSFASAETDQKKRETVRVTVIDRKNANTRRLANQEALIAALRARYPDIEVQEVDFGAMPFAEQLVIAQNTDVLVGVHGAGLTHTMFLREQSTAVVEIQPSDMGNAYMGFRNLANMRGISYFRTKATPVEEVSEEATASLKSARNASTLSRRASWHTENFEIDTGVFIRAVDAGIQVVYNKNMHSHEIV
ncbi:hypothetical protein F503_07612 [Ophiostoma piceae UAMH 11346]|uniref:EGF domain-specific O-linked N-acetylglucosamine transferase n=1 Tax=Ophiostoma piceae (strain UAMH 11346) TaxID=1262450 RepID=S3CCV3_OPHP1|nr:hypothetical protein F503_07612 [Ophiostoma piceae UAMH 11346]